MLEQGGFYEFSYFWLELRSLTLVDGLIDPARARWVRFAKSLFFARAGVVKPRQPLCGLILSDTIFRIFESRGFRLRSVLLRVPDACAPLEAKACEGKISPA